MALRQQAVTYGQRRVAQRMSTRLSRSIPWIGAAVAILAIGSAIRRKGFVGGTVDTALNAVPYVGGLKNLAEVVRGRDFIRDRKILNSEV